MFKYLRKNFLSDQGFTQPLNAPRSRAGFTLIESIVAVFIFSLLVMAISGIFVKSSLLFNSAFDAQKISENSLLIIESISRDIRVSEICPDPTPPTQLTQIREPNSDGSSDWDRAVNAPSRWEAVRDNNDTTYIEENGSDQNQDLNFPPFEIGNVTSIDKVTVHFRGMRNLSSTGGKIRPRLRINGSNINHEGILETMTNSWKDYDSSDWLTNPKTDESWDIEDIENPNGQDSIDYFRLKTVSVAGDTNKRMWVARAYISVTYTVEGIPACTSESLILNHPVKGLMIYSWDPATGVILKKEGDNTFTISSSEVKFTRFNFLVTGDGLDDRQPKVTMVVSAQNPSGRIVKFDYQTTITSRDLGDELQF